MSDKNFDEFMELTDLLDHMIELDDMAARKQAGEIEAFYNSVAERVSRDRLKNNEPSVSNSSPPYEMLDQLFDPKSQAPKPMNNTYIQSGIEALKSSTGLEEIEVRKLPAQFVYSIGAAKAFSERFDDPSKPDESFGARLKAQSETIKQVIADGASSDKSHTLLKSVAFAASVYTGGFVLKGAILGVKEFSKALSKNEKFQSVSAPLVEGAKQHMQKMYGVLPSEIKTGIKALFESRALRIAVGVAAVVGATVILGDIEMISQAISSAPVISGIVSGAAAAGATVIGLKTVLDKLDPAKESWGKDPQALTGSDLNSYISDAIKKEPVKKHEHQGPALG
jgi:hypothetical protein